MYLALAARHAGPVLELAVGTGRIAVALAAAGHDVTGVDRDPDMLDRARSAWSRRQQGRAIVAGGSLNLVEADILDLQLDQRFALVILALNSLLLLGDADAKRRALNAMARHLAENGRAVIDVWLPTPDDLSLYDAFIRLDWIRNDAEKSERVAKSWFAIRDRAANTATVTTTFQTDAGVKTTREDQIWFVGAQELVELARAAGLEPETQAGDYDLQTPSTSQSERVVLVCRKGTAPGSFV